MTVDIDHYHLVTHRDDRDGGYTSFKIEDYHDGNCARCGFTLERVNEQPPIVVSDRERFDKYIACAGCGAPHGVESRTTITIAK